ncbi:uncharacterized protein LOC143376031 [Andrena cerasifolii]|uniref:uncharacterized protein LOC143376031 n=1 Tax=Andrena cerasifolii TaxID=2819439 RepID=UPI0040381E72
MEAFICNKCFTSVNRGKKPFCLTQCGHIYCNGCIQQAEKQCPQCQQLDVFSVELQQPSLSRVENFFAPLSESLDSLTKICGFQNNQIKIMLQRFNEIDRKYDMLKSHYFNLSQSVKPLKDKYLKLKVEHMEMQKKLAAMEMRNRTLNAGDLSTPMNPSINRNQARNIPSSGISSYGPNLSSQSFSLGKEHQMLDGFRIPHSVQSMSSRGTSDTNSAYTFRR